MKTNVRATQVVEGRPCASPANNPQTAFVSIQWGQTHTTAHRPQATAHEVTSPQPTWPQPTTHSAQPTAHVATSALTSQHQLRPHFTAHDQDPTQLTSGCCISNKPS